MEFQVVTKWVLATPMNVAGGVGENPLADVALLRQFRPGDEGEVIIPASSIKGKLRGEAERLLRSMAPSTLLCSGRRAETMCPACWWDAAEAPQEGFCPLCRIFGSPWRAAALRVTDAALVGLGRNDTVIRPGVSLSRVRGTAQEDLLFFVETTPPNEEGLVCCDCRVDGTGDEAAAALVWAAAHRVAAFGNGRSRGRGWVKSCRTEVRMEGQVKTDGQLKAHLAGWASGERR